MVEEPSFNELNYLIVKNTYTEGYGKKEKAEESDICYSKTLLPFQGKCKLNNNVQGILHVSLRTFELWVDYIASQWDKLKLFIITTP